jgi:hypothetical protein
MAVRKKDLLLKMEERFVRQENLESLKKPNAHLSSTRLITINRIETLIASLKSELNKS